MKYFSTFSLAAALLFSISVNAQTSADTSGQDQVIVNYHN